MNTDNKTLADVQPGGRVRLGDQAERARFEAWAEDRELGTAKCSADGMKGDYADLSTDWCWAAWQAALSAQPSPGGQGDVRSQFEAWHCEKFKTRWQTGAPTRDMHNGVYADNYGPAEQQERWELWQAAIAACHPVRIYGCCAQPEGELHTAECPNMRHLAARQPVGEPVAWYYGFSDTGEAGPVTFGGNPGPEAIAWAERHGHMLHYLYAAPPGGTE